MHMADLNHCKDGDYIKLSSINISAFCCFCVVVFCFNLLFLFLDSCEFFIMAQPSFSCSDYYYLRMF